MPHRDLTEIDHTLMPHPIDDDGKSFDLEIGIHLSQECLEDVFVVAIEGGSNYWADFRFDQGKIIKEDGTIDYRETLKKHGIDIYDVDSGDNFESCNAPRIVVDRDPHLHRNDPGYEGFLYRKKPEDRTIFDWEDWEAGFELYAKSKYARGPELMIRLMLDGASEADAEDADMILQFACFGEIIFG